MGADDKFCLRWNDFERNISQALRDTREDKDFFDCTLSCGARQVQAHKVILSACSPFFRSILKQNPHQHPLLYLKGMGFTDLQAVLDFMYHGEVNVAQEELNSFLAVAEELQVKGLTQNSPENESSQESGQTKALPTHNFQRPRPPKPSPPPPLTQPHSTAPAYEAPLPVVKTEPECHNIVSYAVTENEEEHDGRNMEEVFEYEEGYSDNTQYHYGDSQTVEDSKGVSLADPLLQCSDDKILEHIVEDPYGLGFSCGLCGRGFGSEKGHCKRHIKNVHSKISSALSCDFCQKSYKNYDTLKAHQRASHGIYCNK